MEPMYELFDHTADIGIRVCAPTMSGLVGAAGNGLYAAIGELAMCGPQQPFRFDETGEEPAVLLRDYLAELLDLFERDRRVVIDPTVIAFDAARLAVEARSLLIDEEQSAFLREVKAVTYHELDVRRKSDGYEAVVIVDI